MAERNIETQGSRKLKQYTGDLLRNKHFLASVRKLIALQESNGPFDDSVFGIIISLTTSKYLSASPGDVAHFGHTIPFRKGS